MESYKFELSDSIRVKLEDIVVSKDYKENGGAKWNDVVDGIIKVVEDLASCAGNSKDHNAREEESKESIRKSKEKILRYLKEKFYESPPFTVLRIAELFVDPEGQGYSFDNALQISKYFNSLSKLVLVSSSIYDYPSSNAEMMEVKEFQRITTDEGTSNQNAIALPLVEIPWLKDSQENQKEDTIDDSSNGDLSIDNSNLDPMIVSPPTPNRNETEPKGEQESTKIQGDVPQSPTRRRRSGQDSEAEDTVDEFKQTLKKARKGEVKETNNESATTGTEQVNRDQNSSVEEDSDEKMDISNSTIEEVSLNEDGRSVSAVSPNKADRSGSDEKMDISSEKLDE